MRITLESMTKQLPYLLQWSFGSESSLSSDRAVSLGKGVLSLAEFLSRDECNDSRNNLLSLFIKPVGKMIA